MNKKLIITIVIMSLILLVLSGCFPQDIKVTAWYKQDKDCIPTGDYCINNDPDCILCTEEGRSFYSWSEAESYCKANDLDCRYVSAT